MQTMMNIRCDEERVTVIKGYQRLLSVDNNLHENLAMFS